MKYYFEYLKENTGELMTWALLRAWIAAGRKGGTARIVFCREGIFCSKCAASMQTIDSTCRGCSGYANIIIEKG